MRGEAVTTQSLMRYLESKAQVNEGLFRYNYYHPRFGYLGLSYLNQNGRQNSIHIIEEQQQDGAPTLAINYRTDSDSLQLHQLQYRYQVPAHERVQF